MFEGTYDPRDLSNGHYPHLRKVAVDDPEFLDIQRWFTSKGAPPMTRLYVPKGISIQGDSPILPTEMWWEKANGGAETLKLDAALVFNFPHVALVELKHAFAFGNPSVVEMYSGLRKPVQYVEINPIGARWPERDEGGRAAYRPSQADTEPYGAEYINPTGHYHKEKRGWAFISYGIWFKD